MMYILQLHSDTSGLWLEVSDAGDVVSQKNITQWSECPKISRDARLVVLIPGETVTITSVKLPKMRASERQQAIPFLLEEQLTESPENMIVVCGETQPDNMTRVGVINKTILESTIKQLQENNLYPHYLIPVFFALKLEPEAWTILLQDQIAIVRTAQQDGFSVDVNNLSLMLQLLLEKNKNAQPKKIIIWQQNTIHNEITFEKVSIPFETRDGSDFRYWDFAELKNNPAMNFLQGKYRPKSQSSEFRYYWMRCGYAAAAFIGFLFLSQCIQWFYFHHQSIALEDQITQTYQSLFPGATSVLEPRFRTEGLLKQFQQIGQNTAIIKILGVAGKTALQFPHIHINQIAYENNTVQLEVTSKNVEMLGQWSQLLRQNQIDAMQKVLSTDANTVTASVTLKENK